MRAMSRAGPAPPYRGALLIPFAILLCALATPAQAQNVPIWVVVGLLSPLPVFLLCLILGVLARSVRTGAIHAGLVLCWIVLFTLASYSIENDYVIWTPLVLYMLHAVLLLILTAVQIVRRVSGRAGDSR